MLAEREEQLEALLVEREVEQFLYYEAELLDNRELHEWFDHVADDINYRMPRRLMRENTASVFSERGYYFNEDYGSLKARVERFDSEYAWAERPPTRTRRYVTNVRITRDDEALAEDELFVEANLLVYLSRGDSEKHTFFSARREDVLRRRGDTFEIADREIRLDQTVLSTDNISIFL
ncbi:3-phenylpropionate/cinnamic acid dioxygenase subunit beta [Halobellus sp. H-GB7]|uniref:aromatic-ring-hydroxylating dioxygenase subunit beta n=1 Tax=Halobellus sp. H-GB7 TaxID=3069756 RepID=UPI0027B37B18|nr:3-phenylpropionate/cinnamic acid dioxygenase subunit beta [Halobellus sp. H-GB7]MDQ2054584.1 3-phenylpropionate/cinnamic acid dioxygenase subunit beta [Halobellus sp. H-GB7]